MTTAGAPDHAMRIRVAFDPADEWPPTTGEVLHATLVAPGEARIDSVPIFVDGLALHDVVAFTPDEDGVGLYSHRIVAGGHGVVRAVAQTDEIGAKIQAVVERLGHRAAQTSGLWAIDVAGVGEMFPLAQQLMQIRGIGDLSAGPEPLSGLDRAASVMARVRDRCVWTQQITHDQLLPYLVEEAAEVVEAVEAGSRADLREELGDLLWQVLFHAEIASRDEDAPFTIDDVAQDLADKMVRRHPHVFAGEQATTPDEVLVHWNAAKAAEKRERRSVLDGIPDAMPAIARAQKVLGRAAKLDVRPDAGPEAGGAGTSSDGSARDAAALGDALLALVDSARASGVDAEAALRGAVRRLESRVAAAEASDPA